MHAAFLQFVFPTRRNLKPRYRHGEIEVVKELEGLAMAWLRIWHRLPVRKGFSNPETASTISLSRSYGVQGNARWFGRACSPMSPEP